MSGADGNANRNGGEGNRDRGVRIAYLITELGAGGAQLALLRLLARLDRRRFQPSVGCLYGGGSDVARAIRALDIEVHDARMRIKSDPAALLRLLGWLLRARPTVIHTSLFHANLIGRLLGRLAGAPILICSERTMAMESEHRYRLNRWTIGLVDRVIAVAGSVRSFCIEHIGLPARKVLVIHNGVELPPLSRAAAGEPDRTRAKGSLFGDADGELRAALGVPPAPVPVVGCIGRLDPAKGISYLLDACARLPDVHLVLIGDGPERAALAARAGAAGMTARVHFAGEQLDAARLLPAFDLYAQPSMHEGLSNAVLEAMAAGLAVVATDVGGTPEVVEVGGTGLLAPPGDAAALADAIGALLRDGARRRSMGAAGRRRIERHFTIERTVQRTVALYEELLAAKRRAR